MQHSIHCFAATQLVNRVQQLDVEKQKKSPSVWVKLSLILQIDNGPNYGWCCEGIFCGKVPTRCILYVGTVPTFNLFLTYYLFLMSIRVTLAPQLMPNLCFVCLPRLCCLCDQKRIKCGRPIITGDLTPV